MLLKKNRAKKASNATPSTQHSYKNPLSQQNLNVFSKENYSNSFLNNSTLDLPLTQTSLSRSLSSQTVFNVSVNLELKTTDVIPASPVISSSQSTLTSQQLNEKSCKEAYMAFVNENNKFDGLEDILESSLDDIRRVPKRKKVLDLSDCVENTEKDQSTKAKSKKVSKVDANKKNEKVELSQEFLNNPKIKQMYSNFVNEKLSQNQNNNKNVDVPEKKLKKVEKTKKSSKKHSDGAKNKEAKIKKHLKKNPRMINTNKSSNNDIDDEKYRKKLISELDLRNVGLYVYCDRCDKMRYLPNVKDPLDLPKKWYCEMNPDKSQSNCDIPGCVLNPDEESKIIKNLYNAGSIVWARVPGFPWWPAMVDDDPDTGDYYWLEEDSDVPTWYHVTFFDTEVSRKWMRPSQILPFNSHDLDRNLSKKHLVFKSRLNFSVKKAKEALNMELLDRLKTFSFVVVYKNVRKPNNVEKVKKRVDKKKTGQDNCGIEESDSFEEITNEIVQKLSQVDEFSDFRDLDLLENL